MRACSGGRDRTRRPPEPYPRLFWRIFIANAAVLALACAAVAVLLAPEGLALEEAAIATPALTTVWNGQSEVGRMAARALLDRLAGSHEPDGLHLIKPEMRIRQSTGPMKPRK